MQDRLARTSAQPPFLWHCSAFGNGWKAASDARTMLVYIGNGGARVTSTCLHSLHGKFKTFAVHPRNRSSFRIIATKLSATLPRFRRYLMKRVYRNAISFLFFRSTTLFFSLSLSLSLRFTQFVLCSVVWSARNFLVNRSRIKTIQEVDQVGGFD